MFIQLLQGHSILVRKTFEHTNDLEGVTILDYSQPMMTSTITAHRGTIFFLDWLQKAHYGFIRWRDSPGQQSDQKPVPCGSGFRNTELSWMPRDSNFQRSRVTDISRGDREMSVQMMSRNVDSVRILQDRIERHLYELTGKRQEEILDVKKTIWAFFDLLDASCRSKRRSIQQAAIRSIFFFINIYERNIRSFLVEIHKKFSIPFACIVFIFIGAPLGIMSRRGTFGLSASLSLGFFVFYWAAWREAKISQTGGSSILWVGHVDRKYCFRNHCLY